MSTFWSTFLGVLCALYVMREIENYREARKRNRRYCRKEVARYKHMMWEQDNAGHSDSAKQYAKQALWWEKQAKSRIPTHPTEDEEDAEITAQEWPEQVGKNS